MKGYNGQVKGGRENNWKTDVKKKTRKSTNKAGKRTIKDVRNGREKEGQMEEVLPQARTHGIPFRIQQEEMAQTSSRA